MIRVRWTEAAARDLTRICDYIEEHESAAAARGVALAIYQGVSSLTRFPRRARPGRRPDTRELVFPGLPYLAVYRVHQEVIEVIRILHGAQNWP